MLQKGFQSSVKITPGRCGGYRGKEANGTSLKQYRETASGVKGKRVLKFPLNKKFHYSEDFKV